MELLLAIRVRIVRFLLWYNDRAERRQEPQPALHTVVEKIQSPSRRGYVRLLFHFPDGYSTSTSTSARPYPLIIDWHGGGYSSGSPFMDARFIDTLVATPTRPVVVAVEYSLCPEYPYPAALEDSAAAVQWLTTEGAHKYNLDPSRVVLVGFSAGGGLALTTPMWMSQRKGVEGPGSSEVTLKHPLRGIVSIYPNVDARKPREAAKSGIARFLNSVWADAFTKRSPIESPSVSPAAADDALLQEGLPEKIGLYPVANDVLAASTEEFRQRLVALSKQVTGFVEPDAVHAWDKMPIKSDSSRWDKRQKWFLSIAKDIEDMLKL